MVEMRMTIALNLTYWHNSKWAVELPEVFAFPAENESFYKKLWLKTGVPAS